MFKALLRSCIAFAIVSSASLWAADAFDLPDFDDSSTSNATVISVPKPVVSIDPGTAKIQEQTLPPDITENDYVIESEASFSPIEASAVSESPVSTKAEAVSLRKIPQELNRPVRVGVFTDVRELYVKQGDQEFQLTAASGKLKVKQGSKTETVSSKTFTPAGRCLNIAPDRKSLAANCYAGSFKVTANGNKVTAINTIDVEEYLRGVIPYEIGKLDPSRFEALKAQAVAARTYAYKHFGSRESVGFDIYADTKDQVYKGLFGSTALTDSAVKTTAGIVMTYKGEFITAYYHSTCGGVSETMATWGKPDLPYLQSSPDLMDDGTPWCHESSYTSWERKFSDSETVTLFRQNAKEVKSKIIDLSSITSITTLDTLPSGRILTLEIATDKGAFTVQGDKVRWLFKKNGSILPSSFFTVSHESGEWIIRGKGFGHGVGMCQMGVRARAQAGQSFAHILTHYYPGISLEKFER